MVDSIEHLQKIIIFIQALPQRIFLFNWDELPIQKSLDYCFEWSAELGKRHPNMTFISCLQAHNLYTFFLGHKHVLISKKQLRDTKFDMIEFSSNHKGAGYFPTLNMLAFNFPAPNHLTLSLIRGHQHWNSALFALDHFLHQRGSVNVIILNAVAATSTRKAWRLTLEL